MGRASIRIFGAVSSLFTVLILFQNCTSTHDDPYYGNFSTNANVQIESEAKGILENKCSQCHNPSTLENTQLKDILDTDLLINQGWVIPGSPQNSVVYLNVIDDIMPKDSEPLADSEKKLIRDWIIILGGGDPNATPNVTEDSNDPIVAQPAPGINSGVVLYNTYCQSCHGLGAMSNRKGRTAQQITNAINNQAQMTNLQGKLTPEQIQAIADYLGTL